MRDGVLCQLDDLTTHLQVPPLNALWALAVTVFMQLQSKALNQQRERVSPPVDTASA